MLRLKERNLKTNNKYLFSKYPNSLISLIKYDHNILKPNIVKMSILIKFHLKIKTILAVK